MSKHNRERRKLRGYDGGAGAGLKVADPKFETRQRRITITQTFRRERAAGAPWELVHTNLDCGGLATAEAVKVCYSTASDVMKALAQPPAPPELPLGNIKADADGDLSYLTAADRTRAEEVHNGMHRAEQVSALPAVSGAGGAGDGKEGSDEEERPGNGQDLQQVRKTDTAGATGGAAGDGHVRRVQ